MSDAASRPFGALTRRQFISAAAAASSALLFARATRWARAAELPLPRGFLGDAELQALEAMTARIVPSGDSIGAREAGVADYIQGLLSAFPGGDVNGDGVLSAADVTAAIAALGSDDGNADVDGSGVVDSADVALAQRAIFASVLLGEAVSPGGMPLFGGGPFSGRNPFPDPSTGTPSSEFPPNRFADPLPLPRVKRLAWTVRLLGAAAVPEVAANPLATSSLGVDLRQRYRLGIAALNAASQTQFAADFAALDEAQQDGVLGSFRRQQPIFYELAVHHTIEGILCAPEYGGNRDLAGWQLTNFDGDSQPLGYAIYDATIDDYRERPDKPLSTILPADCTGLSPEMIEFLRAVVRFSQGQEFDSPLCFMS